MIGLIAPALDEFLLFGLGGAVVAPPEESEGFDFDLQTWFLDVLGYPAYPVHIPQQVDGTPILPCFTYLLINSDRSPYISGPSGLVHERYQIDAWAEVYDDVVRMVRALRRELDGFTGMMGLTTVQGASLQSQQVQDEAPVGGNDVWTYHRISEFLISYVESVG